MWKNWNILYIAGGNGSSYSKIVIWSFSGRLIPTTKARICISYPLCYSEIISKKKESGSPLRQYLITSLGGDTSSTQPIHCSTAESENITDH